MNIYYKKLLFDHEIFILANETGTVSLQNGMERHKQYATATQKNRAIQ